jgi:hypothetical protein
MFDVPDLLVVHVLLLAPHTCLYILLLFASLILGILVLFLFTLYSSFFFWCLVQSGLFLFLKLAFLCYSSTALAGGYSCVTLTLTLTPWYPQCDISFF